MSDVTALFEGKLKPLDFIAKEWSAAQHVFDNLPADIKPVAEVVLADAKTVIVDAAEFAGTAASAYLASNGGNFATEVANLLSGMMGGSSATSIAGQDLVAGATKLLQAMVAHEVMQVVGLSAPAFGQSVAASAAP